MKRTFFLMLKSVIDSNAKLQELGKSERRAFKAPASFHFIWMMGPLPSARVWVTSWIWEIESEMPQFCLCGWALRSGDHLVSSDYRRIGGAIPEMNHLGKPLILVQKQLLKQHLPATPGQTCRCSEHTFPMSPQRGQHPEEPDVKYMF